MAQDNCLIRKLRRYNRIINWEAGVLKLYSLMSFNKKFLYLRKLYVIITCHKMPQLIE